MLPPWNAVRFDPAHPPPAGHVESYFFKLNDPTGRRALWLKATLLARRGAPAVAEAWAIAFDRGHAHRAAKEVVPLRGGWHDRASFSPQKLDIRVGAATFGEETLEGTLGASPTLRWALSYQGRLGPLVPFPSPSLYTGAFPRSKLVSPSPDARFSGWYEVDGERIEVDGWRGMQGHNWGSSHAFRYAWAHCNQFDQEDDLVFEGLTGKVRVGPALTPPLTLLCIRHRGVRYDWTRPIDWLRARGAMTTRRWEFGARSDLGSVEGYLEAPTEDLVGLTYENPSGPTTYCLNSKLARAELEFRPAGRPVIRCSSRTAALELGTTDPAHGVRVYL